MEKLNMANMNTLFRKGYLLVGVVMAANMFIVNEMKASKPVKEMNNSNNNKNYNFQQRFFKLNNKNGNHLPISRNSGLQSNTNGNNQNLLPQTGNNSNNNMFGNLNQNNQEPQQIINDKNTSPIKFAGLNAKLIDPKKDNPNNQNMLGASFQKDFYSEDEFLHNSQNLNLKDKKGSIINNNNNNNMSGDLEFNLTYPNGPEILNIKNDQNTGNNQNPNLKNELETMSKTIYDNNYNNIFTNTNTNNNQFSDDPNHKTQINNNIIYPNNTDNSQNPNDLNPNDPGTQDFLGRFLSWENTINLIGGLAFSFANNYFKWWNYDAGIYREFGCFGWRSKRFLNDMLQFEGNLNAVRGGFWLIVTFFGSHKCLKGAKAPKDLTSTAAVIMNSIMNSWPLNFGGCIFFFFLSSVQGFVSIPLTFHISNFNISVSLDSIIWGIIMIFKPNGNKEWEKRRKK